ncbi:MAG: SufS family cysteine desulfurase [Lachnospiraceae bacterium]|nr:SufS family cysteine desulfurase [Lachnospiraceae bacterium]
MQDFRKDFPLLVKEPTAYLDNAATAQRPQCVIDAEMDFYINHNANPLRGFYPLSVEATEIYEAAREKVRKFLNADSEKEIIFTRNTSESLNLVAYSYGLANIKAGDEIVISITEHHSNMLPWRMVAEKVGAVVKYLDCEQDGSFTKEALDAAFSEKTRLVAMAQVSNVLGRVNPVEEVIKRAHAVGAVAVIDGAQSVPHMKVDVKSLDADFFAFSGHKLFGPMGIGVLYGKEEILNKMQPFLCGGEMIDSVHRDSVKYAELPHKFEAGTVNAAGAAGLAAAIDYVERIGYDVMAERELALTKRAMEGIKKIPHIHILGSENPEDHTGIITFTIDDVHPHDVSAVLEADKIDVRAGHHCAQPLLEHLGVRSSTRASLMFYNTEEEVDALIASLASVRRRLGYAD